MKTLGIAGGIGPESTIEYYRQIVAGYRNRRPDGSYPPILINSIDLQKLPALIAANDLDAVTGYLHGAIARLSRAGADFVVLASNTPHIVLDELYARAAIPLISIVEATCEAARHRGLRRLGLFGTRFTMQGRFYPDVFRREGIALVAPNQEEQDYIHDRYLGELVQGIIRPETREAILAIVDRMRARDSIDGLTTAIAGYHFWTPPLFT